MTAAALRDRILAFALLLICLGVGFSVAIWPGIRAEQAARAKIDELAGMIALAERRAEGLDDLARQQAVLESQLADHPALQPADESGLTVARLQSDIRALVEASGGIPSVTSANDPLERGGLKLQPIRVQFTGDDKSLQELAYLLEYARPDLKLAVLSIRPLRTRNPEHYLAFDLTVEAVMPFDGPEVSE